MKKAMVLTAAAMLLLAAAPGLIRYSGPAALCARAQVRRATAQRAAMESVYNLLQY
jgi:hypothetical protein